MATQLLLADDSPTIAKILSLALAQEDYVVKAVGTAAEAEKELQQNPAPEIFLVDISLPEKDAFYFAKFIRSNPALAGVRIIFLANSFDPLDEGTCRNAGCDAVIMKPFDPAELRRKLKEVRDNPPHPAAPEANPANFLASVAEAAAQVHAMLETAPAVPEAPKAAAAPHAPSTPSVPAPEAKPSAPAEEKLSPAAQELADFFSQEIALAETKEDKPLPPAEPTPEPDTSGAESIDLSAALLDWAPVSQNAPEPPKESLSDWKSSQKSDPMFDTGESNFQFSPDYVKRISRAFEHSDDVAHELTHGEEIITAPAPAPEVKAAPSPIPAPVPTASAAAASSPTPALSQSEMEEIIRDEVRLICKATVERIAWEVIPELAENIIRQELEKVLKEME